jgi:hypothetical protein
MVLRFGGFNQLCSRPKLYCGVSLSPQRRPPRANAPTQALYAMQCAQRAKLEQPQQSSDPVIASCEVPRRRDSVPTASNEKSFFFFK